MRVASGAQVRILIRDVDRACHSPTRAKIVLTALILVDPTAQYKLATVAGMIENRLVVVM